MPPLDLESPYPLNAGKDFVYDIYIWVNCILSSLKFIAMTFHSKWASTFIFFYKMLNRKHFLQYEI